MSQSHMVLDFPIKGPANAKALPGELPSLMSELARAQDELGTVHFSRFMIEGDEKLLFLSDIDGEVDQHIERLVESASPVLDAIFAHVEDPPGTPVASDPERVVKWLRHHVREPLDTYFAYEDASVQDIKACARAAGFVGNTSQSPLLTYLSIKSRLQGFALKLAARSIRDEGHEGSDSVGTLHVAHWVPFEHNHLARIHRSLDIDLGLASKWQKGLPARENGSCDPVHASAPEGTFRMRAFCHSLDRGGGIFDDDRLVANAGLTRCGHAGPALLGLVEFVSSPVSISGDAAGRANVGDKAMTVIHSALAGGDSIDDCDVLRAGSTQAVLGHVGWRPPTIGTYLRGFTLGPRPPTRPGGRRTAGGGLGGEGRPGGDPVTIGRGLQHRRNLRGWAKTGAAPASPTTTCAGLSPALRRDGAGTADVNRAKPARGAATCPFGAGAASFLTETFNRVRVLPPQR